MSGEIDPMQHIVSILSVSPYHSIVRVEVKISTEPEAGEIYKVDSARINGKWVDMYTLTKNGLNKLFIAAGITTKKSFAEPIEDGVWRGTFEGEWTSIEGRPIVLGATKIYDFRLNGTRYNAKAARYEAQLIAEEAEKIRKRTAEETTDEYVAKAKFFLSKNNPEKLDEIRFIAEEMARQAIAQQAVFAAEMAETGATLRAIRQLLQIGKYTKETLQNCPFVVYRVKFDWDKIAEKFGNEEALRLLAGKASREVIGNEYFLNASGIKGTENNGQERGTADEI